MSCGKGNHFERDCDRQSRKNAGKIFFVAAPKRIAKEGRGGVLLKQTAIIQTTKRTREIRSHQSLRQPEFVVLKALIRDGGIDDPNNGVGAALTVVVLPQRSG